MSTMTKVIADPAEAKRRPSPEVPKLRRGRNRAGVPGTSVLSVQRKVEGSATGKTFSDGAAAAYRVEVRRGPDGLVDLQDDWAKLTANALSPNWAFESGWTVPGVIHLAPATHGVCTVLVWRETAAGASGNNRPQLVGLFVVRDVLPQPIPVSMTRSWVHDYSAVGTPLLHRGHAAAALETFLEWNDGRSALGGFFCLRHVPADGPFHELLHYVLRRSGRPHRVFQPYERAALAVPESVDDYLNAHQPRKRRKEYRRLRSRLAETGRLECVEWHPGDDAREWLAAFAALEASGWKGRAGTAIACRREHQAFYEQALQLYADRGDLLFWKLVLDGRPIAMTFGVRTGSQAWLLKTAYDEAFGRYSPGVLLILEVMATAVRRGDIRWFDSCAAPDHPMIDHIWRERQAFCDVLVGPQDAPATFAIGATMEATYRHGRTALKYLYHKLVKGGRP